MHWLDFFLSDPLAAGKSPCIVLIAAVRADSVAELQPDQVRGTALLFEYTPLGLRSGLYCTDDSSGLRSLVAPIAERAEMAARIAEVLLADGAQIVLLTIDGCAPVDGNEVADACLSAEWLFAHRSRDVARALELAPTFAQTLAKLGKSTRFNLGYYRRRLAAKRPCEFHADIRGMLTEAEMQTLNASSLNPVARDLCSLRFRAVHEEPDGFLLGLRDLASQRWLSVIGGWRQRDATVLYWQTNASGHERDSIGTVMRSYFLEHEISQGARSISFYGGTTHSMSHCFRSDRVCDLVVRRRSVRSVLMVLLARVVHALQRRKRRVNFVVEVLSDPTLRWQMVPPARPMQPQRNELPYPTRNTGR